MNEKKKLDANKDDGDNIVESTVCLVARGRNSMDGIFQFIILRYFDSGMCVCVCEERRKKRFCFFRTMLEIQLIESNLIVFS